MIGGHFNLTTTTPTSLDHAVVLARANIFVARPTIIFIIIATHKINPSTPYPRNPWPTTMAHATARD